MFSKVSKVVLLTGCLVAAGTASAHPNPLVPALIGGAVGAVVTSALIGPAVAAPAPAPQPVYVAPAPVVVQQAPVVYEQAPVYVAPPPPPPRRVYYAPPPPPPPGW